MNKKLFFISFLLILVYCLSVVCAADVNSTGDNLEITEDSSFDLSYADEVYDNSSECDGDSDCVNSAYDSVCAVSDDLSADEDCLGAIKVHAPKIPNIIIYGPLCSKDDDYNDLQALIYSKSEVDLNRDYSINVDVPFNINKNVVIDGHGHSINFNGKSSSYVIKSIYGEVVLKNLHICNGNCRDSGGAIFIDGRACLTVINCTFTDNRADKSGGAIFNANKNLLKVINSTFRDNHVLIRGGAICSKSDVLIENSIFRYNSADRNYCAIYAEGRLSFKDHSIAEFNYASNSLTEQVFSKNLVFDDSIYFQKYDSKIDMSRVNLHQDIVNIFIKDSNDLDTLFKYIKDNNPSWQTLNITLAPYTTYSAPTYIKAYGGSNYVVRSNIGLFVINGNLGSVIRGKDNIFAFLPPTCNVAVNHVIFEDFKTCFMNNGNIYCANSVFNNVDKLILNNGGACFDNCTFNIWDKHGYIYIDSNQNSLTVLMECEYVNWEHIAIVGNDQSTIVVFTKKPVGNIFKDSGVGNRGSFTIVNMDKINGVCF